MTIASAKRAMAFVAGLVFAGALIAAPAFAAADKAAEEKAPAAEEKAEHVLPATNDWYEAADCTTCHSKQTDAFDNDKCLAKKHGAFLKCSGCHDVDELAPLHEKVSEKDKAPSSLRNTRIDVEVTCYKCHAPETLADKTKDCTILTDTNGTVVNPHDVPAIEDHQRELNCVSCHRVHSTTALEKTASRACSSCHHAGVYECGTCHA